MSADKYPSIFSRQLAAIVYLYNNQINARALIGQSAVGYCAGKTARLLNYYIKAIDHKFLGTYSLINHLGYW